MAYFRMSVCSNTGVIFISWLRHHVNRVVCWRKRPLQISFKAGNYNARCRVCAAYGVWGKSEFTRTQITTVAWSQTWILATDVSIWKKKIWYSAQSICWLNCFPWIVYLSDWHFEMNIAYSTRNLLEWVQNLEEKNRRREEWFRFAYKTFWGRSTFIGTETNWNDQIYDFRTRRFILLDVCTLHAL